MKIVMMGLLLFVISSPLRGQGFSSVPEQFSAGQVFQTGNKVDWPNCNAFGSKVKDKMKITIGGSCYGSNLRFGGNVLSPTKDIQLDLRIANRGTTFRALFNIPKVFTYPENYGQSCKWYKEKKKVECKIQGKGTVTYSCAFRKQEFVTNDYLNCETTSHVGKMNKKIKCSFFYNWSGRGYARIVGYTRIKGHANCGITQPHSFSKLTMKVGNETGNLVRGHMFKDGVLAKASARRGELQVNLRGLKLKRPVYNEVNGTLVKESGENSKITAKFSQGGKSLSYSWVSKSFDKTEYCLTLNATFLGQNMFCGSYYSPLMLFFGKKRPGFHGASSFPLYPDAKIISWVEKNAAGYFLALDINKSGTIDSSRELFGDTPKFENGFEKLKWHDKNKDFKIDKSDPIFSQLLLWKDKNGNGISERRELFTLNHFKVKNISLYYKKSEKKYGTRALEKEKGNFIFEYKGKTLKSEIVDIWFAPKTLK